MSSARPGGEKSRTGPWRFWIGSAAALLMLLVALPVLADGSVALDVTVVHVTESGGSVAGDACAQKAHGILGKQVRYAGLECLDNQRKNVALNDIWKVALPNGKRFLVRPIDVGEAGVLVAVDLEGSAQGDFRIRPHKPLVIGGPSHAGGKLVIVLEAGD